jgi:hypothetical protein
MVMSMVAMMVAVAMVPMVGSGGIGDGQRDQDDTGNQQQLQPT